MFDIGFFIGALLGVFVVLSIVRKFIIKKKATIPLILKTHFISISIITVLAGFGLSNDLSFNPLLGFSAYIVPQLCWLIFDIVIFKKK